MITAREELFNHLKHLVKKDEAKNMIEEYKEEIINELYKVYKIEPKAGYIGTSLVAAKSVYEANKYIENFRRVDNDNKCDSWGYSNVSEDDILENIFSNKAGILDYGIRYCG